MHAVSTRQHWIETPDGQLFAQCWSPDPARGAPIVLLHDSLGCVELWRDFPERLALASGRRVIAYDRLGFGRSAAFAGLLAPGFIEGEAMGGFEAVRQHFDLNQFVVLGHSVGAGMAIGCAAAHPQRCQGVISESAQTFVEPLTLDGIRQAERQFAEPGQLERLQKYHGDKARWVLNAWIGTWLSDAFGPWNLDPQLARVRCPLLAMHGDRDEYGSTHHLERMARGVSSPISLHILPECGHVPHREHPQAVLSTIGEFLKGIDANLAEQGKAWE
ncbi:alpha/beta fold hydrolase [Pseudomonas sp. NPDC089569]|uniref:alpha/beta fold hydrolase n=1 Tax=Pseudomonas sp. NPDC089569 TaxID=3390722 RepID=UPI003D07FF4D